MAIALVVSDMDRSISFYKDKLGLAINSQEEGFANFKTKGCSLALLEKNVAEDLMGKDRVTTGPTEKRSTLLAWDTVKDVDTLYKELKRKGVEFTVRPKTMSWGQRVAYFSDPDGNIWEISQWVNQNEK